MILLSLTGVRSMTLFFGEVNLISLSRFISSNVTKYVVNSDHGLCRGFHNIM